MLNEINGVVLPAVDDPDWKREVVEYTWPPWNGHGEIKVHLPHLKIGGVVVVDPKHPNKPTYRTLVPIRIDGDEFVCDEEAAKKYVTAVWHAYHTRRSMEATAETPLLKSAGK